MTRADRIIRSRSISRSTSSHASVCSPPRASTLPRLSVSDLLKASIGALLIDPLSTDDPDEEVALRFSAKPLDSASQGDVPEQMSGNERELVTEAVQSRGSEGATLRDICVSGYKLQFIHRPLT